MSHRPSQQRSLCSGAGSVAASWLIFAALATTAWLVTTLDTPALIGLAASAASGAIGLLAKRLS